jgi:predicted TIM-barrel fold metal-dependent hydrolase
MEIFDCNLRLGLPYTPSVPPEAYAEEAEALLDQMAFCGIDRALVRHIAMEEQSPVVGNQMVIQETASFDPLEPSWAILPPQTGELGTLDEFVARMKVNGVRALWTFPSRHHYLLTGTTFGEFFEIMIQRRIPLFVSTKERSDGIEGFAMIDALIRDFPKLIVVATDHGCWGEDRLFRPLIERYENFYIDTSRYELDGGIRDFCNRYGPYRMLFGTGYPEIPMGGALLTLAHAEISDEAKEAIFGGNLHRLLQEVQL